jgi:pimeloyl-ACP methyl ester carboxylesterase
MGTRRAYADTELGQLHYREAGSGPPVVFLHKTPSSSIQYSRVQPLLADRFRTIALDTPGFGLSDPPPGPPQMDYYARAVVALLDALGLERVALVGYLTGSSIALETATRFPERVERLVLAGILAIETEEERAEWRSYLDSFHYEPDSEGRFLRTYPLPMLERDLAVSPDDPERFALELVAYLQPGERFWWSYRAVVEHRPYELVPLLRAPTLFLNQEQGRVAEQTRRLHAAAPGTRYAELPGGSEGAMDDPQAFADAVAAFLAE